MSESLIEHFNESINWKLKDIANLTKIINLVSNKDVVGTRKFIAESETAEREYYFEMIAMKEPEFHKMLYPDAKKGEYASVIAMNAVKDNKEQNDINEFCECDEIGY